MKDIIFTLPGLGLAVTRNIVLTWGAMAFIIIISWLATRRMTLVPGKAQLIAEMFVGGLQNMMEEMMGPKAKRYLPFIATIAFFVLVSNLMSLIPKVNSPTESLDTTAALGLMVFVVVHASAIRTKGLLKYIKSYFEPVWFLFPLNVIGELAKPLSHSFRLYGNMVGGGIIVGLIFSFFPWIVPVPIAGWFSVFAGVLQTIVFTLLAMAYISTALEE